MRSEDIYPLARQLYAEIPEPLRRWSGDPTDAAERDHGGRARNMQNSR
jgi:hypothetical protein